VRPPQFFSHPNLPSYKESDREAVRVSDPGPRRLIP
jgi:hypothetical protein